LPHSDQLPQQYIDRVHPEETHCEPLGSQYGRGSGRPANQNATHSEGAFQVPGVNVKVMVSE
jgi:hypothetical protein